MAFSLTHPAHRTLAALLYEFGLQCRCMPSEKNPGGFHRAPLLTKQQLGDMLGVSRVTVLGWVHAGKLKPSAVDDEHGWPLFDLNDVLAIARNAIRAGLASSLVDNPLPGPAPSKLPPR